MDQPLEIVFKDIAKTDAIIELINEKVAKLHQVHHNINSCRIAVEKPQKHQKSGSPYRVRLEIRIPPSKDIVVKREPGEGEMHEELATVIRDVFSSGWRKLKEITEKQHHRVKH